MMSRTFRNGDARVEIAARREGDRVHLTTASGERVFTWDQLGPGDYVLRENGHQWRCIVAKSGDDRWVWIEGHVHHLQLESLNRKRGGPPPGELTAPMPGAVLKVLVTAGDTVQKDQTLVVLEAMKMQYEIVAPRAGIVEHVHAVAGTQVAAGVTLVRLAEEPA